MVIGIFGVDNGTLAGLCGVGLIVFSVAALILFRIRAWYREIAEALVNMSLHNPAMEEFEMRPVAAADFPEVSLQFYDGERDRLVAQGFKIIGDFVLPKRGVSIVKMPPAFRRMLISEDGWVLCELEQLPASFAGTPLLHSERTSISFRTEFADGSLLKTTNSRIAGTACPGITRLRVPPKMGIDEMWSIHREALAEVRAAESGRIPKVLSEAEDLWQMVLREEALSRTHLESFGFYDAEEMEAVQGRRLTWSDRRLIKAVERYKREQGLKPGRE